MVASGVSRLLIMLFCSICMLAVNSVGHFTLVIDVVYCDLVVSTYLGAC